MWREVYFRDVAYFKVRTLIIKEYIAMSGLEKNAVENSAFGLCVYIELRMKQRPLTPELLHLGGQVQLQNICK